MRTSEPHVLHVLPHPGGGGETYVDFVSEVPGYRSTRIYLAPSSTPALSQLARGVLGTFRLAPRHDLLHVHGEVASGICLPLLLTRPSVVTHNGLHLLRRLSGPRRKAAALNLRALIHAADQTICVSRAEYDNLAAVVGPIARRRAVVIHNSVHLASPPHEAERAEVRKELGLTPSEPVGIWVGSLDARKDPLSAVRAAEAASVVLLVVGDGPLRPHVERIAQALPVRVLGHRADIPRLLSAADFYVQTSHREGFAFSLLEAMAHGLAPVVTDLPENVEAVGDTGVVVPRSDQEALVAALRRLVESQGECSALGRRARHRVADLFEAETMIARTQAVYDQVLAR